MTRIIALALLIPLGHLAHNTDAKTSAPWATLDHTATESAPGTDPHPDCTNKA